MEKSKKEIISIQGIAETFGISIMTVHRNYLSKLEPVATEKRKKYYDWIEVKKIHDNLSSPLKDFKIIA
ncbi:hypothetical protein [Elizabethkingia miricola]|uniref:hypothetical protein n=1 Tax=Elizabethkingia miricola TaxID=172045 RepID=UPI00099B2197|nr:hypothetical protein [Elizabethkingia miricola]OPC34618.1 hypothetical protein BAX99_07045 [Elizabethkingia miricola]